MSALRILLVDDEPSHLITLAANLELEGMESFTADCGEAALQLMAGQTFDLVLTDVRMPGISGVELFRQIRQLYPELPVVLMTGFAMESLLEEAMREGAFAVLPKPFDMSRVLPLLVQAGQRPTTLIIDSSREEAAQAAAALSKLGIRAQAVCDESSAEQVLRDTAVDICVVDLVMATAGSPPLLERMKQINPQLAFIAISGHDVPELVRKLSSSNTLTWLRKPITAPILARTIAAARASKVARR